MVRTKNPKLNGKKCPSLDVRITRHMTTMTENSRECANEDSTNQTQLTESHPGCSTHVQTQSQTTDSTQHHPLEDKDTSRSTDSTQDHPPEDKDTGWTTDSTQHHPPEDKDTDQPSSVLLLTVANEPDTHTCTADLSDYLDDDSSPLHGLNPEQVKTRGSS